MDGMPPRSSRPSLKDVAAIAGVSGQTVSRVVNDMPNVSAATRDRVEAAMASLGYRPHRAARLLRTGRSHAIGVVVATLETVGNSLMLQAVASEARRRGYSIALVMIDPTDPGAFDDAIAQLQEQDVDGAIVINEAAAFTSALQPLDALRLVLVDADDDSPFPTVRSDHAEAAASIVTLLAADGHTVHHVAGPASSFAARQRELGWRAALAAAGQEAPEPRRGDWSSESGHAAGVALAADPTVRAVFCANDQMAIGVISALHEAGRAVPDEVAVAGFDGIADGAHVWPSLTTAVQDFVGLAGEALDMVTEESDASHHRVRPAVIARRASTRA